MTDHITAPTLEPARAVVVVMGHPEVRLGVAELLVGAGFDVIVTAATARKGLPLIVELAPDVVVIDDHLPDGRGVDLCRQLAAQAPTVPVIIYATILTAHDRDQAQEAGAAAIIAKSLNGYDLLRAIAEHTRAGPRPAGRAWSASQRT